MLKAAVIGVGNMGQHHARVYASMEETRLVGVADLDSVAADRVGARYGVPGYHDFRRLLEEQRPDLVSLAVPTSHHGRLGLELIEQGVHLLVEKPISTTLEEAEQLVERAERAGVVLAVGHVERFNPAVLELRRRLREGMAGRVYMVLAQRLSPYPVRVRDAGVVLDLASHDIDLIRCLMDEPIVRLYGETVRSINSEREDLFHGVLRFRSGALGVLDVNWMTPTKIRRLAVTGGRGLFDCNLLSQELYFYENENAPSQWDSLSILRGVTEGNVLGIRIRRQEPLALELGDFVSAVRDRRPPGVTGQDGLQTLALALEFLRSSAAAEVLYGAEVSGSTGSSHRAVAI